jgi:hypothetical protein
MEKKDIVLAVFGAAVGLAGILLVFVGFVYGHAETITLAIPREKHKLVAKMGIVPFLLSLLCATFCLRWMSYPSDIAFGSLSYSFYSCMGLTALYGIVAFLFYL